MSDLSSDNDERSDEGSDTSGSEGPTPPPSPSHDVWDGQPDSPSGQPGPRSRVESASSDSESEDEMDAPVLPALRAEPILSWSEVTRELKQEKITLGVLNKYEQARIVSERALQLQAGALSDVEPVLDTVLWATKELEQGYLDDMFVIERPLPGSRSEYWRLGDLQRLQPRLPGGA